MLPVVHVISVIDVVDIDVIGPVPNRRPGFRARINHTEPEASELETWGTLDHHDWDVVDAKPVSTAKMRMEAIFWNAVSAVAAAFVPAMMLMLPVSCTLALPDVLPRIACFGFVPSGLAQMSGGIPAMGLMPGPPLDRFPGIMTVLVPLFLVPLFRPIAVVSVVLRRGLASVFLLVTVAFLPAGITFLISTVMLRSGKHRCTQHQNQY
jgi:hypothetical protein